MGEEKGEELTLHFYAVWLSGAPHLHTHLIFALVRHWWVSFIYLPVNLFSSHSLGLPRIIIKNEVICFPSLVFIGVSQSLVPDGFGPRSNSRMRVSILIKMLTKVRHPCQVLVGPTGPNQTTAYPKIHSVTGTLTVLAWENAESGLQSISARRDGSERLQSGSYCHMNLVAKLCPWRWPSTSDCAL